jgi:4-nitrophenyl phosphatase
MRTPAHATLSFPDSPEVIAVDRDAIRGVLFDWDGCVALGGRITPAAASLLRRCHSFSAIVSNNTTHDREAFAAMLRRVQVDLPLDRIVLAGVETLRWAAKEDAPTLLIGSRAMRREARRLEIRLVNQRPARVLLLRDTGFSYATLQRVVDAIGAGAQLIVANRDRTHPGAGGRIVPETGALLAAITACVGEGAVNVEIGKPAPALYRRACAALGIAPNDAVMIGDNPDTDIAGARQLGMGSILVGPLGTTSIERLAELPLSAWPVDWGDQKRLIDKTSNVCRSEAVARS